MHMKADNINRHLGYQKHIIMVRRLWLQLKVLSSLWSDVIEIVKVKKVTFCFYFMPQPKFFITRPAKLVFFAQNLALENTGNLSISI